MTDTQLYLAIGIPTFFVLVSALLSRSSVSDLREDMNRRFDALTSSTNQRLDQQQKTLDTIEHDLREFYKTQGDMKAACNPWSDPKPETKGQYSRQGHSTWPQTSRPRPTSSME